MAVPRLISHVTTAPSFQSPSSIALLDSPEGIFDPNLAGAGEWTTTFSYSENNCVGSESIKILVQSAPNTDFSITSEVCVGELVDLPFAKFTLNSKENIKITPDSEFFIQFLKKFSVIAGLFLWLNFY